MVVKQKNGYEHACQGHKLIMAWEAINVKMHKCRGIGLAALAVPTRRAPWAPWACVRCKTARCTERDYKSGTGHGIKGQSTKVTYFYSDTCLVYSPIHFVMDSFTIISSNYFASQGGRRRNNTNDTCRWGIRWREWKLVLRRCIRDFFACQLFVTSRPITKTVNERSESGFSLHRGLLLTKSLELHLLAWAWAL